MDSRNYLTNIPESAIQHGICKTLMVRRLVIDLKHIFTEIFVRKTIDIEAELNYVNMSLFQYMETMTNRNRHVHKISRSYVQPLDEIVKRRESFFPMLELYKGLDVIVVLDFDGLITDRNFHDLYKLILERHPKTVICTANPTVNFDWFEKNNLPRPSVIYARKGAKSKLNTLIDLSKKHDITMFIDNEPKYLEKAWLFGIYTYHWCNREIKHFTRNTK